MRSVWLLKSGLVALVVVICLAAPSTSWAQSGGSAQAEDKQVTQALLDEVKLLRQALQRMSVSSFRAQILTERLRVQQEQVNLLNRELDGLRSSLANWRSAQPMLAERAKDMESQLTRETDPARRQQLERQLKDLQFEGEHRSRREQQDRDREMQLTAKLQIEQAKLNELNERLDALERELEGVSAAVGAPAKSKQP